jgi:peptide/nickel transport system ATP-binding protein
MFIPQSIDFLDPLMRVGKQVVGVSGTEEKRRQVFERYGLGEEVALLYPHQLSGGMARRVLIATAMMEEAKLIIADEPTPGLSDTLANETMERFREAADAGTGLLIITHDIDLAVKYSDRVAVFYAGSTIEIADAADFKDGGAGLRHPYSKALVDALPQNSFESIPGTQPYAGALPAGCLFADRCPRRTDECLRHMHIRNLRGGKVRCIHAD